MEILFLVSVRRGKSARRRREQEIPKVKKMRLSGRIFVRDGKAPVTRIFVSQFAETQMALAAGVRCQVGGNISGTIIQGIGPSPTEKQATNATRKTAAALLNDAKVAAIASKQTAEPATLKRATVRRPARSNSQMATKVIPKFISASRRGVDSDPTMIIDE